MVAPLCGRLCVLFGMFGLVAPDGTRTTIYVSEVKRGTPNARYKVSRKPECCGWADILRFDAFASPQPGSTQYFVLEVHDPDHTFQISTDPPCCGWSEAFSFHAFANARPGTDRVRILELQDKTRMRYKLGTKAPCCGWVEKGSFYAHGLAPFAGQETALVAAGLPRQGGKPSVQQQRKQWKSIMGTCWLPCAATRHHDSLISCCAP